MLRYFLAPIWLCAMATSTVCDTGYLPRANDAYGKGNLAAAVGLYKQALHNGENATLASFNLGNCYFQLDSLPSTSSCLISRAT